MSVFKLIKHSMHLYIYAECCEFQFSKMLSVQIIFNVHQQQQQHQPLCHCVSIEYACLGHRYHSMDLL